LGLAFDHLKKCWPRYGFLWLNVLGIAADVEISNGPRGHLDRTSVFVEVADSFIDWEWFGSAADLETGLTDSLSKDFFHFHF